MSRLLSRIDKLDILFQRFNLHSFSYPPTEWPDKLPSIEKSILEAREKAEIYCNSPGKEYLLVGFGKWERLKSGRLQEILYEPPLSFDY